MNEVIHKVVLTVGGKKYLVGYTSNLRIFFDKFFKHSSKGHVEWEGDTYCTFHHKGYGASVALQIELIINNSMCMMEYKSL